MLSKHVKAYHGEEEDEEPDAASYRSPYRFAKVGGKFICPLGCQTSVASGKIIRKHLVNEHKDTDLAPWGYSRDLLYKEYLLLLEKADLEEEGDGSATLAG